MLIGGWGFHGSLGRCNMSKTVRHRDGTFQTT